MYRMYITDCLRGLVGGESVPRYVDLVDLLKSGRKETETAEQIIERLSDRLDKIGGEKNGGNVREYDQDRG